MYYVKKAERYEALICIDDRKGHNERAFIIPYNEENGKGRGENLQLVISLPRNCQRGLPAYTI